MPANFGDADQMANDTSAHEQRVDGEKTVGRNPHPDFTKVQASRPDWREERSWNLTKTRSPNWKLGDGANDGGESLTKQHVEIDPYEEGRPAVSNYKLLISGIIPRPIGFLSTRSKDGTYSLHLSGSRVLERSTLDKVLCHFGRGVCKDQGKCVQTSRTYPTSRLGKTVKKCSNSEGGNARNRGSIK